MTSGAIGETSPSFQRRLRKERLGGWLVDRAFALASPTSYCLEDLGPEPRVGVLLQWGIGDAVLTLPLLKHLRRELPECHITAVGKPWLPDLFSGVDLVDDFARLVPPWAAKASIRRLPATWLRFGMDVMRCRSTRFDLLVSARYDIRDTCQLAVLRAGFRGGFGGAGGARLLSVDAGVAPHRESGVPVHLDAVRLAEALTNMPCGDNPTFPADDDAQSRAACRLAETDRDPGPVVVLARDAGHPVRRWHPGHFREVFEAVADKIGLLVQVEDPASEPKDGFEAPPGLKTLRWRTSLREVRGLLASADLAVCCDSGVMHMASASGCKVVAVFGPTAPEWYGPSGSSDTVIAATPMPCRPCYDRCIYQRPICMEAVDVGEVQRAVEIALGTHAAD